MRKRKYVSLDDSANKPGDDCSDVEGHSGGWGFNESNNLHLMQKYAEPYEDDSDAIEHEDFSLRVVAEPFPIPQCHNIVSTSQIVTSQQSINLQRLADLYPFTTYDRKRFAAITIRLANPHCTCLLFGSGKLVITGSTSFSACIVASHEITRILRRASPRDTFEVSSCTIQNLVGHVSLAPGTTIDLNRLYERFNEQSTYQRSVFPGLVLRPPRSPIVLLVFTSGRIVCTGGRSYDDIYYGFQAIYETLKPFIIAPP
jgi:transcription initiation factor TFIID TATA-box-binding protein